MAHKLVWFDIPVKDINRAMKFYAFLFNENLTKDLYNNQVFAILPHQDDEVSGCLVESPNHVVAIDGVLIYLNLNGRIDEVLQYIEDHGGKVLADKEKIGPWGYRAIILDTEGNRIALHSYT